MDIDLSKVKGYVDNQFTLLNLCRGNNTSQCSIATALAYLSIFYLPCVVFIGMVCNILVVYVFWVATKKKTRQIIYLGALAIVDIGNIVVMGVFWYIPAKGLPFITNGRYHFLSMNVSNFLCVLHRFLLGFFSCLISNYYVLINADRVLTIYFPLKFRTLPNKYSWILVAIVLAVSFFFVIPLLCNAKWVVTIDDLVLCQSDGSMLWKIHAVLFTNCGLLAGVVVILLNMALVVKLLQIKRSRRDLQGGSHIHDKSDRKEISACIVLMLVSLMFITLSLPIVVSTLLAFYPQFVEGSTKGARYFYTIYDICYILFLTQCSTNWIIYMCRMKSFRDEIIRIFRCSSQKRSSNKFVTTITSIPFVATPN